MVSTPKAPDPMQTAQAQAQANQSTATTQQLLNMTDQVTPDGSLTYSQDGSRSYYDPVTGKTVDVPAFTATQTLSAANQKLYDTGQRTQQGIADIAEQQTGRIGTLLGKPVDINNEETEARLFGLGSKRLDPKFAREEEALRTRLANSGIQAGSAAYDAEMSNFAQGRNDAYNQLLLTGRGQAVQEALAERNQPINEISALLSGSQVSQPRFTTTPQTGVDGVDYTGLVNQKYQADLQASQAKMGGLFGLGSTLLGGLFKFSDRRLKTGVERVGTLANGLPLYVFDYIGGPAGEVGVMADEARALMPDAVEMGPDGFDRVDYAMAGV